MGKWIMLWVVSIASAAGISAGVAAQVQTQTRPPADIRVLSGGDVGFRVEGQRSEKRTDSQTGRTSDVDLLTGHLVVRVNGQWVDAEISGGRMRPLTN